MLTITFQHYFDQLPGRHVSPKINIKRRRMLKKIKLWYADHHQLYRPTAGMLHQIIIFSLPMMMVQIFIGPVNPEAIYIITQCSGLLYSCFWLRYHLHFWLEMVNGLRSGWTHFFDFKSLAGLNLSNCTVTQQPASIWPIN